LAPAARGGIPVPTRIPASERTSQKLEELLTQGVADGDTPELLKLAVRKIVEEALEADVAEAVGRGVFTRTAPSREPAIATAIAPDACARRRGRSSMACRKPRSAPSRSCPGYEPAWPDGRRSWNDWPWRCSPAG